MKFQSPLLQGHLISRYKRFFADVEYVDKQGRQVQVTIHVPNTGSLKTVIEKSPQKKQLCWFSLHNDPEKKLKGTLEAVQTPEGHWVGVNTSNPNRIVTEAIQEGLKSKKPLLSHWSGYTFYKPEYKISKETRLDGVLVKNENDLQDPKSKKHFIEIKNTTFKSVFQKQSYAQFPDAVTERGQKHILEMMNLMKQGHTCELIFTVQRSDVQFFSPCLEIDAKYAELLRQAHEHGLIVSPLVVELSQTGVHLTNKILKPIWMTT